MICDCGSLLKKINKQHYASKKHQQWVAQTQIECFICCTNVSNSDLFICDCCSQSYCNDCKKKVSKCPFCRKVFFNYRILKPGEWTSVMLMFTNQEFRVIRID